MSEAGIPGEVLDQLEAIFREHAGPGNAITSGELSEQLDLSDGEANPKTREAVRVLCEERGVPIAASNRGYFLIENTDQLEDYLDTLDSRIAGIQERKQLATSAWNQRVAGEWPNADETARSAAPVRAAGGDDDA